MPPLHIVTLSDRNEGMDGDAADIPFCNGVYNRLDKWGENRVLCD